MLTEASEAEVLSQLQEAQTMMEEAIQETFAAYKAKNEADVCHTKTLRKERQHFSDKLAKSKGVQEVKLNSDRLGFDAIIKHLNQKHGQDLNRLKTNLNDKDLDMVDLEETHNKEMRYINSKLSDQKKIVHEQRQQRRRAVQDTATMKAECQEHVKGMDLWLMDMAVDLKVCTYFFLSFLTLFFYFF